MENNLIVSGLDNIIIESKEETLKNVVVYDILGRELTNEVSINNRIFTIPGISKTNSVLLLKITLSNNAIIYKKVVF